MKSYTMIYYLMALHVLLNVTYPQLAEGSERSTYIVDPFFSNFAQTSNPHRLVSFGE